MSSIRKPAPAIWFIGLYVTLISIAHYCTVRKPCPRTCSDGEFACGLLCWLAIAGMQDPFSEEDRWAWGRACAGVRSGLGQLRQGSDAEFPCGLLCCLVTAGMQDPFGEEDRRAWG